MRAAQEQRVRELDASVNQVVRRSTRPTAIPRFAPESEFTAGWGDMEYLPPVACSNCGTRTHFLEGDERRLSMTTVTFADPAGLAAARYCFCADCAVDASDAAAPPVTAVPSGETLEDHVLVMRDATDGRHPRMFHGISTHTLFTVTNRYLTGLITEHGRSHQIPEVYDRAAATLERARHQASTLTPVIVELGNVPPAQWQDSPAEGHVDTW